jgi:hypothetical protein
MQIAGLFFCRKNQAKKIGFLYACENKAIEEVSGALEQRAARFSTGTVCKFCSTEVSAATDLG